MKMKKFKVILAALMLAAVPAGMLAQNPHAAAHKKLIAKRANTTEQVNLRKNSQFIDFGNEQIAPESISTPKAGTAKSEPFHRITGAEHRRN